MTERNGALFYEQFLCVRVVNKLCTVTDKKSSVVLFVLSCFIFLISYVLQFVFMPTPAHTGEGGSVSVVLSFCP